MAASYQHDEPDVIGESRERVAVAVRLLIAMTKDWNVGAGSPVG